MKKPGARSMVTVTVLPLRSRSTVPKFPVPNPELELPCVRLTMQLVVEAQRSADAGLAGRMPARLPAATMLANPSRKSFEVHVHRILSSRFLAFCEIVRTLVDCNEETRRHHPLTSVTYRAGPRPKHRIVRDNDR